MCKNNNKCRLAKLWPSVNIFTILSIERQAEATVQLARRLQDEGFEDMQPEDINELLDNKEEISLEIFFGRVEFPSRKRLKVEDEEEEPAEKQLTFQQLHKQFHVALKLTFSLKRTSNASRSTTLKQMLNQSMMPYHQLYKVLLGKTQQRCMTEYFKVPVIPTIHFSHPILPTNPSPLFQLPREAQ